MLVVEPAVEHEYADFLNYAETVEVVTAKDLIKYQIPKEIWHENKPRFEIGHLAFEKPVAGLMFNSFIFSSENRVELNLQTRILQHSECQLFYSSPN